MTDFNLQQANLEPAAFNLNINSPGFLGGQNVHNLLILVLLSLMLMRR